MTVPEPGRWRNSPAGGGFLGEDRQAIVGEEAIWCKEGLESGVGGTSDARLNVNCWKPGVLMVRFVGFFRPVRGASFSGDVGAENAWDSDP